MSELITLLVLNWNSIKYFYCNSSSTFFFWLTLMSFSFLRICLHNTDLLRTERFSIRFYEKIHIQATMSSKQSPVHAYLRKRLEMLYYLCHASRWQYYFVQKQYVSAHIALDWTRDAHAHHDTVSTNTYFCKIHKKDNSIIFKNVYVETCFQKFAF